MPARGPGYPALVIATASVRDTARVVGEVLTPIVAQGVIARRRRAVALAGALGLDERGVRTMREMRDRYGSGPLRLRVPVRPMAVLLTPEHVHRVLTDSPEPFAAATLEKRGALRHFQPHGVLVSHGRLREERRRFVESALDTGKPVHRCAEAFTRVAREEARVLLDRADARGVLDWDAYIQAWWRVVRRIVFGDGARDDHETTDLLTRLRARGNWSGFAPRRPDLEARLRERLQEYVTRAEAGSLAALVAAGPPTLAVDPVGQLPQWLFAFDAAGMAAYRALALFAAHPEQAARARSELTGRDLARPQDLPLLRAGVLESVRLWPTTPIVLRETTEPTGWEGATLPAGTGLLIVSAFFHHDGTAVPDADRFVPDRWCDGSAEDNWALVPFSAGPAVCPGRELVLFSTSTFLAALVERHDARALPPFPLEARRPVPAALDPFALRFVLVPHG